MTTEAVFSGGPYDGYSLAIVSGQVPGYLLLAPNPVEGAGFPLIVGIDYNDSWPGQERYERGGVLLGPNEHDEFEVKGYLYEWAPQ